MIKDITLLGLYDSATDQYIPVLSVDNYNVGFSALALSGKLDVYKFVKSFKDNAANNILTTPLPIPIVSANAERLELIHREYNTDDSSTGELKQSNTSKTLDDIRNEVAKEYWDKSPNKNKIHSHSWETLLSNNGVSVITYYCDLVAKIFAEQSNTSDITYYIYTNTKNGNWAGLGSATVIAQNEIEAHGLLVNKFQELGFDWHIDQFDSNNWIKHNSVNADKASYITHVRYEE